MQNKFEFVEAKIRNLKVPMILVDGREYYIIQKTMCELLGISRQSVMRTYRKRKGHFECLKVSNIHLNGITEFLREHKSLFGVSRVREDTKVWTLDDMFAFAMLSRKVEGIRVQRELRKFVAENMKTTVISAEEFAQLSSEREFFRKRCDDLEERNADMDRRMQALEEESRLLRELKPFFEEEVAKMSGKSLKAQRKTKEARLAPAN